MSSENLREDIKRLLDKDYNTGLLFLPDTEEARSKVRKLSGLKTDQILFYLKSQIEQMADKLLLTPQEFAILLHKGRKGDWSQSKMLKETAEAQLAKGIQDILSKLQ